MPIGGIAFWVLIALAPLGWLTAFWFYMELRRWAHQAQHCRIAIAYNRRVMLEAPIVEWLEWANLLRRDQSTGRIVYRAHKVSVSVLAPRAETSRAQTKVEKQT